MEEFTIFISRILFYLSWQLSHHLSCLSRIGTMLRFRDILHIVFRMRVRCTANTRHRPSGSLMFDQLLRRWPNIKPATSTGSRVVFAGDTCSMISSRLGDQQSKGEEHKPGGVNQTWPTASPTVETVSVFCHRSCILYCLVYWRHSSPPGTDSKGLNPKAGHFRSIICLEWFFERRHGTYITMFPWLSDLFLSDPCNQ